MSTPSAVYYVEKEGGGLSSMLDVDGVDWLGFHNAAGSGHKGEYRRFPNAVHRQDGNYFHAMNAGTDPSTLTVDIESEQHVRITFTSGNDRWRGQWGLYADRCDFTMSQVSVGHYYWLQYEGVPGGSMNDSDYWYSSADNNRHPINEQRISNLPVPEWMAFGDANSARILYVLHHNDDTHPDDYVSRPDMTVLGIGRREKNKFLDAVSVFSIGFAETTNYTVVNRKMRDLVR